MINNIYTVNKAIDPVHRHVDILKNTQEWLFDDEILVSLVLFSYLPTTHFSIYPLVFSPEIEGYISPIEVNLIIGAFLFSIHMQLGIIFSSNLHSYI